MSMYEISIEELFKIEAEARKNERERAIEIIEKTRQKLRSSNPMVDFEFSYPTITKCLDEMVDEIKGN